MKFKLRAGGMATFHVVICKMWQSVKRWPSSLVKANLTLRDSTSIYFMTSPNERAFGSLLIKHINNIFDTLFRIAFYTLVHLDIKIDLRSCFASFIFFSMSSIYLTVARRASPECPKYITIHLKQNASYFKDSVRNNMLPSSYVIYLPIGCKTCIVLAEPCTVIPL